jgi:hypothetical protein
LQELQGQLQKAQSKIETLNEAKLQIEKDKAQKDYEVKKFQAEATDKY